MIITQLNGGIGNQMFQYAIARSLAIIHNTEFKLDISAIQRYNLRPYQLNNFNIIENIATTEDLQRIRLNKGKLSYIYNKITFVFAPATSPIIHVYKEKIPFNFDPMVLKIKKNIYLIGYWQSEKYFKNVADIIKKDFIVKPKPDEKNEELLAEIRKTNSVAIHVRRGDYVSNPVANKFHGSCDIDYYKKSIDMLVRMIDNPTFFVFSDDPVWSKENMKVNYPTVYIFNNGTDKGYEDLRLMRECKYFIIANSSFSWWGAWLSTYPKKIVLAPRRWIVDENKNVNDVFPSDWKLV